MKGSLPDQTRMSLVHLRTPQLETELQFYSDVLGLSVRRGPGAQAALSPVPGGPALLLFSEERDIVRGAPASLGLEHLALQYPSRQALAWTYWRLRKLGYPVVGASDNCVSQAMYLKDPDGNGVKLYADRPQSHSVRQDGQVDVLTAPLDLDVLFDAAEAQLKTRPSFPIGLSHVHLRVASLHAAERFYGDFLGLAVTQRSLPGALFFGAGDHHYQIAVNASAGRSAAHGVGLVSYRIEVPIAEILYCLSHRAPLLGYETRWHLDAMANPLLQIRDPNGTWLEVQASSRRSSCVRPGEAGEQPFSLTLQTAKLETPL